MYPKTISDIVITISGKYHMRNRIYRWILFKQVLFKLCQTIIKNLTHCSVYKEFKEKDKNMYHTTISGIVMTIYVKYDIRNKI